MTWAMRVQTSPRYEGGRALRPRRWQCAAFIPVFLNGGAMAVNHVIGVRVPAPERWRLCTTGQCATLSRWRVGSESRRRRETRVAQWQSTALTGRRPRLGSWCGYFALVG